MISFSKHRTASNFLIFAPGEIFKLHYAPFRASSQHPVVIFLRYFRHMLFMRKAWKSQSPKCSDPDHRNEYHLRFPGFPNNSFVEKSLRFSIVFGPWWTICWSLVAPCRLCFQSVASTLSVPPLSFSGAVGKNGPSSTKPAPNYKFIINKKT